MCYCFSGLAFLNSGHNLDSPREIGIFCELWSLLCWFLCEIFGRELWFEKKILLVVVEGRTLEPRLAVCGIDCHSRIGLCSRSRRCSQLLHQRRIPLVPRDWRVLTRSDLFYWYRQLDETDFELVIVPLKMCGISSSFPPLVLEWTNLPETQVSASNTG